MGPARRRLNHDALTMQWVCVVRPNPVALKTRLEVASRARPPSWDSVWLRFASLGAFPRDFLGVASWA